MRPYGLCVAGKILDGPDKNKWVRTIPPSSVGQDGNPEVVYKYWYKVKQAGTSSRRQPKPLDILAFQSEGNSPENHQTENIKILNPEPRITNKKLAERLRYKPILLECLDEFQDSQIYDLLDTPDSLWTNGYESDFFKNNRVTESDTKII